MHCVCVTRSSLYEGAVHTSANGVFEYGHSYKYSHKTFIFILKLAKIPPSKKLCKFLYRKEELTKNMKCHS